MNEKWVKFHKNIESYKKFEREANKKCQDEIKSKK